MPAGEKKERLCYFMNVENKLYEGSVTKKLIAFAFPFLISNIVQSCYNVADMMIVGNFCGPESMSGVNIGGQVTFILTNIIFGLCSGGTVLIAQYIGSNNQRALKKATSTLFTMLLVAGVIVTAVMLVFKNPVLSIIQTPADAFSEASSYLTVTVTGIIFIFGYNALSAIMRAMGDSRRPLYFVTIACVTNVGLDLLFVGAFGWAAFGAALATVISQALSLVLCIAYMMRNGFIFDFKPKSFRIDKEQMKLIVKIGTPSAVQNGISSVSFLFITALVNVIGGTIASAAVGAVGKFNGFALMPTISMSAAISTMSGQNIGAGKWDRAIKSCKIGTAIAVVISVAAFAAVQIFPESMLRLFGSDAAMIAAGVEHIRSFSFDYLVIPFVFCINGLYIGAGHTFFTFVTSMLSSLLLRVPAAYLFGMALNMGLAGVGLAAPVASAGSMIVVLAYLVSGKWRTNAVAKDGAELLEQEVVQ